MRRPTIALALLAIVALLGPVWPGARLSVSTGTVEIGRGEPPVWKTASAGDELAAGDRVRTGGDGRAELTHHGATLRLYPNSVLRLPQASATRGVELENGSSLFDVLRSNEGDPFEVRTPEVVVSVKGTRFGVALDGNEASVSVFRGLVGVQADAAGSPETLVHAGFAARGLDHFELSWHGAEDPWEGWNDGGSLPAPGRDGHREAALREARRVAALSARELPVEKGRPRGERDRGKGSDAGASPPASPDPGLGPVVGSSVRDLVSDGHGGLRDAVHEGVLGNLVDHATGGLLTINFIDGSGVPGPDVVHVVSDVTTWVFDEDQLEEIVDGDELLPVDLVSVLDQQGLQQLQFTNQLLGLFGRGGGGGGDDDDDDDDDDD
jgi:hypothetical protein